MGGATPMSVPPKEDPTKLELRARPAPVTRLNRRTLAVLVGGLAAAVALVTWWAFRPPKPQEAAAQDVPNIERVTPAEGLQRLPSDYQKMPAPVTPSTEENPPAAGEHIDEPIPVDQAARAGKQRLQSEAEAAAQAPVLFRTRSEARRERKECV